MFCENPFEFPFLLFGFGGEDLRTIGFGFMFPTLESSSSRLLLREGASI